MTTWVEIDRAALVDNVRSVRQLLGPATGLCAVVKANGYGHGALLAARASLEAGAVRLAVTTVEEALELRREGLTEPILLLASHAPDEAETVVVEELTATVSDRPAAERLQAAAVARDIRCRVHLLVDCGMGRDGCPAVAAAELHRALLTFDRLEVEGVWCHFPTSAEADKEPTRRQLARFLEVVGQLTPRPSLVHAANSAAAVDLPESRLDLARIGTLLYGQYPSPHVTPLLTLRETWRLKSRLVEVRRLPAGTTIGYGSEHRLRGERLIGTLLVGWQHGFTLLPASLTRGLKGAVKALRPTPPTVRVRGVECPVVGRIAMQSCCVDVTGVPGVAVGDVAEVPCRRVTCDRGLPRVVRLDEA